jgi:hypothetical protein
MKLDSFFEVVLNHLADDIPVIVTSSFLLGYSILLSLSPDSFLELSILDKAVQSFLMGFWPSGILFIVFEPLDFLYWLNDKLAENTGRFEKKELDKDELRERKMSMLIITSLIMSSLIFLGYFIKSYGL